MASENHSTGTSELGRISVRVPPKTEGASGRAWHTFSAKGWTVNLLQLGARGDFLQLCSCSTEEATHHEWLNGYGYIPIKLYIQKHGSQVWSRGRWGHSFLILRLIIIAFIPLCPAGWSAGQQCQESIVRMESWERDLRNGTCHWSMVERTAKHHHAEEKWP